MTSCALLTTFTCGHALQTPDLLLGAPAALPVKSALPSERAPYHAQHYTSMRGSLCHPGALRLSPRT